MDVLADLLERARARGAVFALSTLSAPWGIALLDRLPVSAHVVLRGECWLVRDGAAPLRLLQGDVALLTTGEPYRLLHEPGAEATSLDEARDALAVPGSPGTYRWPGEGPSTLLLCGAYRFHGDVCDRLLADLPPVVLVRSGTSDHDASVRAIVGLLADEVARDAPGRSTALDRLLDLLLVHVLRAWFGEQAASGPPRWYRALGDPEIGRALRLVHEDPAAPWTVASLASAVGLSRAAFARRFQSLVGEPPLSYVTGWRMALAAEQLRDTTLPVARIGRSVGYENEFAFSTAFRRSRGVSPSAFRAGARDEPGYTNPATRWGT